MKDKVEINEITYTICVELSMLFLISADFRLYNFCPTTILTFIGIGTRILYISCSTRETTVKALPVLLSSTQAFFTVGKNLV